MRYRKTTIKILNKLFDKLKTVIYQKRKNQIKSFLALQKPNKYS